MTRFDIMKAFHELGVGKKMLKSAGCLLLLVLLQQPLFAEGRQPDAGCPCQTCAKEECHERNGDADFSAVSEKERDNAQDGRSDGKGVLGWFTEEIHIPNWELCMFLGNAVINLVVSISRLNENFRS